MKRKYRFNTKNLGFMQGRLVNLIKKNIQYFPDKNWKKELFLANKCKYKKIEWTINYENINQNPLYNGDINQVKKLLNKYKIKCNSVTCDFLMQKPFFKKKFIKDKKKILDDFLIVISNCISLKIKYLIFPLVDRSRITNKKEENILINDIKNIIPDLKNLKILFEIDFKPKKVKQFIEKFDEKKFGINYDTGNSAGLNYSFKDEIRYFKYVKNIHIKDRKKFSNTVRLGKGNWDFVTFFKFIKNSRYNGNLILQTARSSQNDHIQELNLNRDFVKKYL